MARIKTAVKHIQRNYNLITLQKIKCMPKITTEKTIKRHKNIRLNKEDEEIIKNHMLSSGKKASVQLFFDEKVNELKNT